VSSLTPTARVTTCRPIINVNEHIGMNFLTADNNNSVTYLLLLTLAMQPYWIVGSHAYESLKYRNNRGHADTQAILTIVRMRHLSP